MILLTQPRRWPIVINKSKQDYIKQSLYSVDTQWTIASATISKDFRPDYNYDARVMDAFNCVHAIYHHDHGEHPIVTTPYYDIITHCKEMISKVCDDLSLSRSSLTYHIETIQKIILYQWSTMSIL
jgi:hypothetical protein